MVWYENVKHDRYSQYGEDGILTEIYRRLGIDKGFFVEFGAWDGKKYSNSYNLLAKQGWSGVYIEGDRGRFADLERNIPGDSVLKICAYVLPEGAMSLDSILAGKGVADAIDLLSIDIDSDDYAVWEGVRNYHPVVVVVEYNPTIPLEVSYVQPRGRNIGNSARALCELGKSKGYTLVAMTTTNLVFVRNDRFPQLGVPAPALENLMTLETTFRVFYGYDGTLVHVGPKRFTGNPWQARIPGQIPQWFRYYGASGGWKDRWKDRVLKLLARVLG